MSSVVYVLTMYLLWIVNFLNGSGYGRGIHLPEITRSVVILLAVFVLLARCQNKNIRTEHYIFGGFALVAVFDPLINGYGWAGLDYIWVFFVVFLLSLYPVDNQSLNFVGIGYAAFGLAVLLFFNFRTELSGWNSNSIAMLGLHSFLVFIISFTASQSKKGKIIVFLVSLVYIYLINATNSRSCMVFVFIGMLFAISIIPSRVITKSNRRFLLWLLIPLFVAILVIWISKGSYMDALNKWSIENTKKPIFNMRDYLWEIGFNMWQNKPFWGTGDIINTNWHNSVVACLVTYGIIGLILWMSTLYIMLCKSREYLYDSIVTGCVVAFIILYLQQSVELGFFSSNPDILPYIILGIMFGRIKRLKQDDTHELNNGFKERVLERA